MRQTKSSERAVSISTGYIINMGMGVVAISILLFSLQGIFTDITDMAAETEMEVVGEKVANEIEKVDRIARRGGSADTRVNLPNYDSAYTVRVGYEDGEGVVRLVSGGKNVEIGYTNVTAIEDAGEGIEARSGNTGGSMRIRYNKSKDRIVIE
jgi:hypothetical protein